jgi:hypothetical protein
MRLETAAGDSSHGTQRNVSDTCTNSRTRERRSAKEQVDDEHCYSLEPGYDKKV